MPVRTHNYPSSLSCVGSSHLGACHPGGSCHPGGTAPMDAGTGVGTLGIGCRWWEAGGMQGVPGFRAPGLTPEAGGGAPRRPCPGRPRHSDPWVLGRQT